MVPLLGVVGLSVDLGWIFMQYRLAQNAADAAAIAGARTLATTANDTDIQSAATSYASSNGSFTIPQARYLDSSGGYLGTVGGGIVPLTTSRIEVQAQKTFETFFAHVVGIDTFTVNASAQSSAYGLSTIANTPVWPVAVRDFVYVYDLPYTLPLTETDAPGSTAFIDFNGKSHPSKDGNAWFLNGFNPSLQALQASYDYSAPGTWQAVNQINAPLWLAVDPGIGGSNEAAAASKIGTQQIILMYDAVNGNGSNTAFRITGFAMLEIMGVSFTGNPKMITGKFKRAVVSNETGGGSSTSSIKRIGIAA